MISPLVPPSPTSPAVIHFSTLSSSQVIDGKVIAKKKQVYFTLTLLRTVTAKGRYEVASVQFLGYFYLNIYIAEHSLFLLSYIEWECSKTNFFSVSEFVALAIKPL